MYNNNNNNHFILGRSVSPSKWTHSGEGFFPLFGGRLGHAYHPPLPIPAFPPYTVKTLHPGMRTAGKTNCQMWNRPKDVEQAQRCGTKERSAILVRALKKNGCRPRCGTTTICGTTTHCGTTTICGTAQRCGTGPKMWNKGKISNTGNAIPFVPADMPYCCGCLLSAAHDPMPQRPSQRKPQTPPHQ